MVLGMEPRPPSCKSELSSWRDSTEGRKLAFHGAKLGSIPSSPYGSPSTSTDLVTPYGSKNKKKKREIKEKEKRT